MSTRFELPLTAGHAGEILYVNPTETGYLWGPGPTTVGTFIQVGHGFSVDDVIRSSGVNSQFTRSQADNAPDGEVIGIVISVPNPNTFVLLTEGFTIMSALPGGATAGSQLFLSDTVAGALTISEPTTPGLISKPVAQVIDGATRQIYWHNYRGKIQPNPVVPGGSGGGNIKIDQTPDNGTYGLLSGAVNGVNTLYTVSSGSYLTGTLSVYLNGLLQLQGAGDDWTETAPGSGTFTFNIAPLTGDIITATYQIRTFFIDQTPDNGTYGLLAGAVNGVNTVYTTSQGGYSSGSLTVYLNGLMQLQGPADDWQETTPGAGTFTFAIAPLTGDIITVQYQS